MKVTNTYEQLSRDEGKVRHVYADQYGIPTCGIGHNLRAHPVDGISPLMNLVNGKLRGQDITEEQCQHIFDNDLKAVLNIINYYHPWATKLDDARFGVIRNMVFQLGSLTHFPHFCTAMENGDWQTAAKEMEDSAWYHQVPERAKRLIEQVLTGQWV